MKKNGFIATSLIYSFFLIFIAILAALLNNYIANKTILLRYNEENLTNLNTQRYNVYFDVYNSSIQTDSQRGIAFTNLAQNGNFLDESYWDKNGGVDFKITSFSKNTARLSSSSGDDYMIQKNKQLQEGHLYYFSLEYSQNGFNTPIQSYVDPEITLITQDTNGSWEKISRVFEATESRYDGSITIGQSTIPYTGVYFTNVMLIDLTSHFGAGNEPNARWMDEHIDFFNTSMQYLFEEKLSGGEDLSVRLVPSPNDYRNMTVECTGLNGKWLSTSENTIKGSRTEGENYVGTLDLKNITDDIKCVVRWNA